MTKPPEDYAAEALPCTCAAIDDMPHQADCWTLARPAVAEQIRAAVVEAREEFAAAQWQLFKTAPADGREILAFRPDAGIIAVLFREPEMWPDDDEYYEPCWFTLQGEDLTGDLPVLWHPYPDVFDADKAYRALQPKGGS